MPSTMTSTGMSDFEIETETSREITFLVSEENSCDQVNRALQSAGATVENERPPQKIKLAYPIKKQPYAFLGVVRFRSSAETLQKLEGELKLDRSIIRYMVSRVAAWGQPLKTEKASARRAWPVKPEKRETQEPVLTNEALEKKIEELLN